MLHPRFSPFSFVCVTAVAGMFGSTAFAADWTNINGGAFDVGGNWDPRTPGSSDTAFFDLDGETFTVTFEDVSPTNNTLRMDNGNVTFWSGQMLALAS